jgi:molecular chaperone DnaK (HSP70)
LISIHYQWYDNKANSKKYCNTNKNIEGVPLIEVTFEVDVNVILKVSAEDKGTGNKNNIVINDNQNTGEDIDSIIKDAEKFADEVKAKNELLHIFIFIEKSIS